MVWVFSLHKPIQRAPVCSYPPHNTYIQHLFVHIHLITHPYITSLSTSHPYLEEKKKNLPKTVKTHNRPHLRRTKSRSQHSQNPPTRPFRKAAPPLQLPPLWLLPWAGTGQGAGLSEEEREGRRERDLLYLREMCLQGKYVSLCKLDVNVMWCVPC